MKRVSFKVAKALKEAGYWQERLCGDYPIWKIEDTVIRFDTPGGVIGYGMPTYIDVWLWLWREKDIKIDIDYCINKCAIFDITQEVIYSRTFDDPEDAIINAIEHLGDNNLIK